MCQWRIPKIDIEAYSKVVELFVLAHELGESIWSRLEFWTGVSFGAIALGYVAPNRLTPATTVLILTLYLGFSLSIALNISGDLDRAGAYFQEGLYLAAKYDIDTGLISSSRELAETGPSKLEAASLFYIPGLMLGVIGYLFWTSYTYHIKKSGDA